MMLLSVLVQQARNFLLLDKELTRKLCCNILYNTRIHHNFEDTYNLNNSDCYILYESKVHVSHTEQLYLCHEHFCTNPTRKFGMFDITHGLVSVYYTIVV